MVIIHFLNYMTIEKFISNLGIELVGEKAVKKLEIKSMKDFWNFNDSSYVIGQNIIEFKKENKEYIEEIANCINIIETVSKIDSKGKVAMTGSGPKERKELLVDIEALGYEFTDSINKETSILLCEDVNGTSNKLVKARKLGIELKSYSEFFN